MLEIGHELDPEAPMPEIVMTRGDTGEGVETLDKAIRAHRDRLVDTGRMERRKRASLRNLVISWATGRLQKEMEEKLRGNDAGLMESVYERRLDPIAASEEIFNRV
jgi:LAO/AO transport system kinase